MTINLIILYKRQSFQIIGGINYHVTNDVVDVLNVTETIFHV